MTTAVRLANVTGDATVATVIAAIENELNPPDNEGEEI